jgi:chromosome segregation protein
MYLKRLELVGFKSFADRTEFTFPSSVTAVVGPNGCGKSNVVDAFKWIFGEQSAKGMRGEEMKDVIFNGTLTRKPTGFAEVTAVFDNEDRALDIDYSEVAITRRLFRSGESEYLINKQKCRLRDIKGLLLDTGLGTSSYSILEQGKIDVLLQASTIDRRIIFEEAAGISRYRVKKAETLRALQRTEENLARLGDIIDEVEKRMHRLKVQAGKARRYREHYDRLRALRVRAALEDYRSLIEERAIVSSSRFLAEFRLARLDDVARRLGEALEAKRAERRAIEGRLTDLRARLGDARTRRERTEERIAQDRRRLEETDGEIARRIEERAAAAAARSRLEADLERGRGEIDRSAAEIAELRGHLESRTGELEALGRGLEDLRREIEVRRQAAVEAIHARSKVANRIVALTGELTNLGGRRDRVSAALETARREAAVQAEARGRLEGELRVMQALLEEMDRSKLELDAVAQARGAEIARAGEELTAHGTALQDRRSRLDVLRRYEESREGVGKAAASVLAGRARSPAAAEVRGMVADAIRVDRRFALAVEAALGEHASSLVVETQEGGLALLEEVRDGETGGLAVLALDRVGPPPGLWDSDYGPTPGAVPAGPAVSAGRRVGADFGPTPGAVPAGPAVSAGRRVGARAADPSFPVKGKERYPSFPVKGKERYPVQGLGCGREGRAAESGAPPIRAEGGVLGLLRDRVVAAPGFRDVVDRLLEGVVLVDDLRTAVALSRNGLRPFRIVTLGGALIDPRGAMVAPGAANAGGIISRRSEMAELEAQMAGLEEAVRKAKACKEDLARALQEIEAKRKSALSAREAEALKIRSAEGLLVQAGKDLDRAAREVRVAESELGEISEAEAKLLEERKEAEAEAERLDRRREEEEAARGQLEARASEAAGAHKTTAEAVTDLKVRLAEAEERGEGLRRSLAQLETAIAEEDRRGKALEGQVEDLRRRLAETGEDLRSSETSLTETAAAEKELAAGVEAAAGDECELAEWEASIAAELDRVRAGSAEAREERERFNLREQEGKLKRNSMVEKIADEYGLDLAAIAEGRATVAGAVPLGTGPEGMGGTTPSGSGALAAAPEGGGAIPAEGAAGKPAEGAVPAPEAAPEPPWNRQEAEAEMAELREKIRHIGNVNLEALDELDELEGRYRFLTAQRDDLRKAEKDLGAIIGEINRTSRELFLKTFESVQKQFNDIFRKCFGGGMAELVLEDGADVLEAGIEIIARPPGKKLTSLSLMSGGEKTMTTIALLFAIFRSRPSPFCILDEVDAPLDENNVRRFVVLLRDFVKDTQFIIVSHNKITMAEADTLYGVTMEERGVSKRVAVEFESYDPDHPESLLAGPSEELNES